MSAIQKGRYRARFAMGSKDVKACQQLRFQVFRNGSDPAGTDRDQYDIDARHVMIEDAASNRLVCCYRLYHLNDGRQIDRSYSAQFYDLSRLQKFAHPMVEIGRFCIDAGIQDADILRIAWGFLAQFVNKYRIEMLFGCSSFQGIAPEKYRDSFALLGEKYLAPMEWRPLVKARQIHCFTQTSLTSKPNFLNAMKGIPPLLRTYIAMGGRVSDHAVLDAELNTTHVFTGLMTKDIPVDRVKVLNSIYH